MNWKVFLMTGIAGVVLNLFADTPYIPINCNIELTGPQFEVNAKVLNTPTVRAYIFQGTNTFDSAGYNAYLSWGKDVWATNMVSVTGTVGATYIDFNVSSNDLAYPITRWYCAVMLTKPADGSVYSLSEGYMTVRPSPEVSSTGILLRKFAINGSEYGPFTGSFTNWPFALVADYSGYVLVTTYDAGTNLIWGQVNTNVTDIANQVNTNAGFQALHDAQVNTNSGFQDLFDAQENTNTAFQALHDAQANTNTGFQALHDAQVNTNSGFQDLFDAQVNTNTGYQDLFDAQANTNTGFQALHDAQANTNADVYTFRTNQVATNAALLAAIVANGTNDVSLVTYNAHVAAQANTNAGFQSFDTAQANTNAGFQDLFDAQVNTNSGYQDLFDAQANTNADYETRIASNSTWKLGTNNATYLSTVTKASTAYGWGDHADAGYLSALTTRFDSITIADLGETTTNLSTLTQGVYTGVLSSVSFTGTCETVVGRTYLWGFTKANAFGTSTLSASTFTLTATEAGAVSNYFTPLSVITQVVLQLDGNGSSKSDVSTVYLKQSTNGSGYFADDVYVGDSLYLGNTSSIHFPDRSFGSMDVLNWQTGYTNAGVATNFIALQTATNTAFQNLFDAQANTNAIYEGRIGTNEAAITAQENTNAIFEGRISTNETFITAQGNTNAVFEGRIGTNESDIAVLDTNALLKTGGTMSGDLNHGGHSATALNNVTLTNELSAKSIALTGGDSDKYLKGDGTEGVPEGSSVTYPVFDLPLGGQWTDFEIKASTNNFTNLVYYYISSGTNATADDTNVWVYFTDDYRADVRQWIRQDPVGSNIYFQLTDPLSEVETVYVYPSHDCTVEWSDWMIKGNTNLIWSYVRFDGVGFEMNYDDTLQHWSAIQPVEWVSERLYIDITSGVTNTSITNRVFDADPWTTSTLDGTNGTYHDSGTNRYWILMP